MSTCVTHPSSESVNDGVKCHLQFLPGTVKCSKEGKQMNNRIKLIRSELNLTQQQFAERIGINRSTVANIESGKKQPSRLILVAICHEYGVNKDWLFNGNGNIFLCEPNIAEAEAIRKKMITRISNLSDEQLFLLAEIAKDFCKDSESDSN